MIFTLTDRHYNVLDAYETDDYLIGQYIGSILETLEINVLVKSLNAEHWVEGNYIMCQDKKGKKRWFTIYDCEDSNTGDSKSLFCYSGTIDIVAEDAAPISAPEAKPFKWYFDRIFYDTGIELGINEISDLSRKLEFTSENASNAEMLQYVLNGFDNAEASLDVEFDGATPTKLVLNVYKRIGNEEPQAILSDEDDSLTSLERKGSISDLATCINPTGAEDENGNPITLLGKYYEEKDENGNILYYSPVDSPRVFSVVAHQNFYVQLPGKANGEFDGYINRRYESQATTQDTLWQESLAQLKKIDHVAVTYEANGYIDCSIGDNVQIVSHEMKPPVMIAARTIEYKFNDDDPSRNVYKFGNYVELASNLDDLSKIIAEVKKQVEPQVIEAERNAKAYAKTVSEEKAAQAEENAKGYTDTVKVQVVEHANTVANQAENNAKSHADTVAEQAESNAKAYALSEADKARIAAIQAAATDAQTKVNAAKTALEASIAEKADAEWVNGQLVLKADNSTVQDLQNEVSNKADVTWVNNQLVLKENAIHRGTTAPTDTTKLWLDTSVVPNVLKRYDSATSSWVKATPTSAREVGAYTKTEVDNALNSKVSVTTYTADKNGIISRLDSAESRITQNEQEIATKVSQTDYDALEGRVSQAESSIIQNANAIQSKVSQTDFNALKGRVSTAESTITQHANLIEQKVNRTDYDTDMNGVVTRLNSAESRITQNENEIATKVSQTTFTQELAKKENSVVKSNTAPSNPSTNQLWLDTSVTPNVLKRWNGSAWVKATPTTANEVGAYTKSETDTKLGGKADTSAVTALETRMTNAETSITQNANQIELKANKTDVYTKTETDGKITTAVNNAKAEIKVTTDSISQSVSSLQSTVNSQGTRLSSAESSITQLSTQIQSKVTMADVSMALGDSINYASWDKSNIDTFPLTKGTRDTTVFRTSFASIKLAPGETQASFKKPRLPVNPGEKIYYEFWILTDSGWDGKSDNSKLRFGDQNGGLLGAYGYNGVKTTWTKYSGTFVVPNGVTSLIISFGNDGTTGNVWIDDIILAKQSQWESLLAEQTNLLTTRLSTAESTITQQADLISQKVSKTDYNGNTIASLINQTATTIKLQAAKIALDGYVEAKHIKSLNGLNVGNGQFVVDANGNVKFAGNLEGASGTFGEVTVKDGDFYLKDTKSGIRYSLVKKTNILGDHSFELIKLSDPTSQDNIDHWWLPIITDNTNWVAIGAPRGVPTSISGPGPADAMPIFGNFAVMVNSTNYVEQPIWDITSNTQYTFSVHAKRPYNNTPGAVRLEVHYKKYNTDGTSTRQLVAAQSFDTVASDYSVSRHALTFTSPNVARTGSDEIIFVIKGVNANWVHVDGVQVVKSAYPTVYDTEDSLWSFMNSRNGFKARAIWTEGIYNGVNGIDIDDNRIRIYSNASLNYFSVENIESRFSTVPYDQWKDPEPNVKKSIKVNGGISTDGLYANARSVNKDAIRTNGKIYVGGEGIEIVWPGGMPYIDFTRVSGADYNARIIIQSDSSLAFMFDNNAAIRHRFYANGTKSGGSIEVDGKNLGMSPIDSPQVLLETIEFDVPLTETGTKVLLDTRFAKAVNCRFAVFPNRGEVIEKGADYFVIAGEGMADIRIVGERVGYAGVYFDDMTVEGVN